MRDKYNVCQCMLIERNNLKKMLQEHEQSCKARNFSVILTVFRIKWAILRTLSLFLNDFCNRQARSKA